MKPHYVIFQMNVSELLVPCGTVRLVGLACKSVDETLVYRTIPVKAIEQFFHAILFH